MVMKPLKKFVNNSNKVFCCLVIFVFLGPSVLFSGCSVEKVRKNKKDIECGISENECDLCSDFDKQDPKFLIVVVGDGVQEKLGGEAMAREYPVNRGQGEAMWKGVQLAYDSSEVVKKIKHLIDIKPFDDGGSGTCARKIAECIFSNPCVIAVIGHATSGTTLEAAEIYSRAGIPLIMPIATSPYVFYPHAKNSR